jgi:type IV secretion system T-DNA border endonuclease VirD2
MREAIEEVDRAERDADLVDLPPTVADVLSRLRDDPTADPFRDPAEREALRGEITALIGEERSIELAIGDDAALDEVLEDRLDRLYMAKAYLQSDANLASSIAMEHVLDEIANEEIDVQRERNSETDGEGGVTHG